MMNIIKAIFPGGLQENMEEAFAGLENIQEIRIRVNQNIFVRTGNKDYEIDHEGAVYECKNPNRNDSNQNTILNNIKELKNKKTAFITNEDIEAILTHLCRSSRYAYEEEWKMGFMTLPGGHRVGIAGQVVQDETGVIKIIKYVRFIHIRIAHEKKGVAKKLLLHVDREKCNCLIVSPPGFGKTTLIRDLIRELSDGDDKHQYKQCCIIDERGEIGGLYQGIPQMDVGKHTDIYGNCSKEVGMMMAIRSMGPEVIAVDELGNKRDVDAIQFALKNGCSIIASIHGSSMEEIRRKDFMKRMLEEKIFHYYIVIKNLQHEYEVYDEEFVKCSEC